MTRGTAAAALAATLLLLGTGRAGAQPATLAEAFTPDGLALLDVRAPDDPRIPVRLRYAPAGQDRAHVWIDVHVATSPEEAVRYAAGTASRVQSGLPARRDVGDRAWGDGGMIVLARGPVAVAVRVVAGSRAALPIARHVDAALVRARATAGAEPRLHVGQGVAGGAPAPIRFEGDVLAAHVSVGGAGYARRTRDGWVLVRTGTGPVAVRALVVGSDLRVHRLDQVPAR